MPAENWIFGEEALACIKNNQKSISELYISYKNFGIILNDNPPEIIHNLSENIRIIREDEFSCSKMFALGFGGIACKLESGD